MLDIGMLRSHACKVGCKMTDMMKNKINNKKIIKSEQYLSGSRLSNNYNTKISYKVYGL